MMISSFCQKCSTRILAGISNNTVLYCGTRSYTNKGLKRFYKNVTISQGNDGFEINLDKRKLKTPLGSLFEVPSEALALGVAQEWQGQHRVIKKHTMHLTSLCNTAIDNPTRRERSTVIKAILEFLHTDTLCYRMEDPPDLVKMQAESWDPILRWLKDRYDIVMHPTTGIAPPDVPPETRAVFEQHLKSYDSWGLVGYQELVETLKSMALTCALVDRAITVEAAVRLSRLEQEFQTEKWGNVEWYHDVELMEVRSRVAAAALFIHLTSQHWSIKQKRVAAHPV